MLYSIWQKKCGRSAYQRSTRRYEYVVFNVDSDIEEEALKTYITTNESNVIELSRLSKPEWNRQSYRVLTYYSEKEKKYVM